MNALLVDLDDTLLDYSGDVEHSWAEACHVCCLTRAIEPAALVAALGPTRRWFWDDPDRHRRERINMLGAWTKIVAHAMERIGLVDDELADAVAREYAERRRARMRLFPEALACLEQWKRMGVRLGLVTNGDARQQRYKIERWGLARFFETIVIEGEFGTGKPDEVVYREALAKLGATPAEAWMVGDHLEFDVGAPQRLGLRGVWIDREGRGLPLDTDVRPWRIIGSLTELVDER